MTQQNDNAAKPNTGGGNTMKGLFSVILNLFQNPVVNKSHNKGFTLIELLVVVLIIGILSSVALPQYQKAVNKSRLSEAWTTLKAMNEAVTAATLELGRAPSSLDELPISFGDGTGSGRSFSTKYYTYGLDSQIDGQGGAYAVNADWNYVLGIAYGQRHCYDRTTGACKKLGFSKTGTGCTSSAGPYVDDNCYVE